MCTSLRTCTYSLFGTAGLETGGPKGIPRRKKAWHEIQKQPRTTLDCMRGWLNCMNCDQVNQVILLFDFCNLFLDTVIDASYLQCNALHVVEWQLARKELHPENYAVEGGS